MNIIDEYRSVQEDGTLYLRGIKHIKFAEYRSNHLIKIIIIGSSVQTIGPKVFFKCHNLEEIIFEEPCQIKKIGDGCFDNCSNLRKIDLPVSIQEIDGNAFKACPLERVILRGPCRIGNYCFRVNSLTDLHIADSIQELDENAFYHVDFPSFSFSELPCKIYIRPKFQDRIKRMFRMRTIEFIGDELEEGGYVLK